MTTRLALLLFLASLLSPALAAGEKTTLSLPGKFKTYRVPAIVIAGKTLAVASESADEVAYKPPFGGRNSRCTLMIGAGNMVEGLPRTVADYREFGMLKTVATRGKPSGDGVGSRPFENVRVLREDRTSIITITRWRENNRLLYGMETLVLADDLPLRLIVLMVDKEDDGREKDLENGLADWASKTARANPALPQRLTAERHYVPVAVPIPPGFERLDVQGPEDDGRFCRWDAPRPLPEDGSAAVLGFVRVPGLERETTHPAAYRRAVDDAEAGKINGLNTLSILDRGAKHCLMLLKQEGRPDAYVDFIFVKSRLLITSYHPANDNRPQDTLTRWRLDIFRTNGELPD